MKLPRNVKRYCPKCRKHEEHRIVRVKGKSKSALGRVERRRKERIKKGYGSTPYNQPQKSHRHNVKTTKKLDIRYECASCKKQHPSKQGMRVKKLELT